MLVGQHFAYQLNQQGCDLGTFRGRGISNTSRPQEVVESQILGDQAVKNTIKPQPNNCDVI